MVAQRADEEIKKDVVDQIYWDSRIDASAVSVRVEGGKVALAGKVRTPLAVRAANDDAWLIEGVRSVHNLLELDYRTPPTPDEELSGVVAKALRWAPEIDPVDVVVGVDQGWVELTGKVATFWEKGRAEELAANVAGVLGVTNKLSVVPTLSVTDGEIAQEITAALERNANVDPSTIDIKVEEGNVTLTGSVPRWSARQAAYETALFTQGVTHIHDDLSVGTTVG